MRQEIDASQMRRVGIENLNRVLETVGKRKEIPEKLDAVLVFSGPGNYDKELSPGDSWMMGWMDRDRVRFGVALYHEYVAQTKARAESTEKDVHTLSEEDMRKYGPLFVYNGVDSKGENEAVLAAFQAFSQLPDTFTDRAGHVLPVRKIPPEKLVVLCTVQNDGQRVEIAHTRLQVVSLFQEINNQDSPLFGANNIAIVSHGPHIPRIQFYLQKSHADHPDVSAPIIYPFVPHSRARLDLPTYIRNEAKRWVSYARDGHLSETPYPLSIPEVQERRPS